MITLDHILNAGTPLAVLTAKLGRVPTRLDFPHGQEAMPPTAIIHKGSLQTWLNFDHHTIVNIAFNLLLTRGFDCELFKDTILHNRDTTLFLVRDVDEHLFFHSSDLRRSHQLPFCACRACLALEWIGMLDVGSPSPNTTLQGSLCPKV